jgi:diguanylate cyclase (GGDEF)-like protein
MSNAPRILLCDHRGEGLEQFLPPLSQAGYDVRIARSVVETLAELEAVPADLVVLDPLVEGGSVELARIEASRGSRGAARAGAPPELLGAARLLCSPGAGSPALELLSSRANDALDVLRRDASAAELLRRVARLLAQAAERRRVAELEHQASHDDRTDLLRPQTFERRLAEHVSAAGRHHFELAFVLLDLDHFGQVNKTWDHTLGDRVIAKVAEVIRGNLRQEDVAGRLGGDEFGALLPYTRKLEAAHAVRRLRDEIARLSAHFEERAEGLVVSASIGFETYDGTDLDSLETLRRHAEIALREAKRRGGGQALYYRSLARAPGRQP